MMAGPGSNMVPLGYGHMRASHADRERAVDVLKAAFAEGRLDQEEYVERVGHLYTSRTYAELATLTADLPVGPLGTLAPPEVGQYLMPARYEPTRPVAAQTNGMAIASFILGLGAFLTAGITAPPAFILGIAALIRINRTGEMGSGLAVAGVILAPLAFLIWLAVW